MRTLVYWQSLALVLVVLLAPSVALAAFFDGATVGVTYHHRTSFQTQEVFVFQPVVVGPGVELSSFGTNPDPTMAPFTDVFSIDISDTDILITLLVDQPENVIDNVRINDVPQNVPFIKAVYFDPSSTFEGAAQFGTDVGPDVVVLLLNGLAGKAGQFVLLHVTPEPGTSVLAVAGCAMWLARRRK